MSRGLGDYQRAILTMLADLPPGIGADTAEIAEATASGGPQVRRALASLSALGYVRTEQVHIGWRGEGEYGPWRRSSPRSDADLADRVTVIPKGEPLPWTHRDGTVQRAWKDTTVVRAGMPVRGLLAWLPERMRPWDGREERMEALRRGHTPAEAEPRVRTCRTG